MWFKLPLEGFSFLWSFLMEFKVLSKGKHYEAFPGCLRGGGAPEVQGHTQSLMCANMFLLLLLLLLALIGKVNSESRSFLQ